MLVSLRLADLPALSGDRLGETRQLIGIVNKLTGGSLHVGGG